MQVLMKPGWNGTAGIGLLMSKCGFENLCLNNHFFLCLKSNTETLKSFICVYICAYWCMLLPSCGSHRTMSLNPVSPQDRVWVGR